jgi:hypothetical protein
MAGWHSQRLMMDNDLWDVEHKTEIRRYPSPSKRMAYQGGFRTGE